MSKIIVCDHCKEPISQDWSDICPVCYAAMKKALEEIEAEEEEEKPEKVVKKTPTKRRSKSRTRSRRGQVGILTRLYRMIFGNP